METARVHRGEASGAAADRAAAVRRVTGWGLAVNLGLSGLKFTVGLLGASQALIADAVHSLSDSVTDVAILVGAGYWTAPADAEHPHGHGRIESLVSLLIAAALAAAGAVLGYHAIVTLPQPHAVAPSWFAFAGACVSIAGKEALYRWTVRAGRRIPSSAVTANAWHHRSDALSSIPVAVAVLGARLWPGAAYLDHLAAVLVCVFILRASGAIAYPALRQLIDAGAGAEQREAILRIARQIEGVRAVHALRTRDIGTGLQVDLHALVDPDLTVHQGHQIATALQDRLLASGPRVADVLVHVEPFAGDRGEDGGSAEGAPVAGPQP